MDVKFLDGCSKMPMICLLWVLNQRFLSYNDSLREESLSVLSAPSHHRRVEKQVTPFWRKQTPLLEGVSTSKTFDRPHEGSKPRSSSF